MEETKKCPYCGEIILSTAKKCRHCGEWLNDANQSSTKKNLIPCPVCGEMIEEGALICPHCNEKIGVTEDNPGSYHDLSYNQYHNNSCTKKEKIDFIHSPISEFANLLFWIAIIACFIMMSHNTGILYGGSRWGRAIEIGTKICTYIPEWIANGVGGIIDAIFAYALYVGMKSMHKPMKGLLKIYFIYSIIAMILVTIVSLPSLKDDDSLNAISLIVAFFGLVISFIISINIINNYSGILKKFGVYIIIYITLEILFSCIIDMSEKGSNISFISSILLFGIEYYYYKILRDLFYDN